MGEPYDHLTERERECLQLVARGHSSKEIGALLGISHHTVDVFVKRSIRTLGAADRRDAARIFQELNALRADRGLVNQPQALAEPAPDLPIIPPVEHRPVPSFRVPFLRQGRQFNDLTSAQRLWWIPLLALLFMFVIANFFNGLGALYTITR